MAERYELLDAAIQAILDGATEVAIPRDLEPLVAIAADLVDLPRPESKRRFGGSMSKVTDVTPYLVAEDVDGLIAFVKRVFDAEETFRTIGSAGGTHCEVNVRGRRLMIGGGLAGRSNLGSIHVFVPDVDAVHQRAVDAGATSLYAPMDQEYGARDSAVRDPFGNEWYIATETSHEGPDLVPYFHPAGAAKMLEFFEQALGAEVIARHEAGGSIVHAKVRLGNAVAELGEAHGQWQPIPMMLFVNVDDADAAYAQALRAGATSISEPKNVEYGRSGAVEDAFGNQWHLTAERSS